MHYEMECDSLPAPLWQVFFVLFMCTGLIAGAYAIVFGFYVPPTTMNILIGVAVGIVYFAFCYFVTPPEPEWGYLSPLKGIFSARDEIARVTLVVMLIMIPGFAIWHALVDLVRHVGLKGADC